MTFNLASDVTFNVTFILASDVSFNETFDVTLMFDVTFNLASDVTLECYCCCCNWYCNCASFYFIADMVILIGQMNKGH